MRILDPSELQVFDPDLGRSLKFVRQDAEVHGACGHNPTWGKTEETHACHVNLNVTSCYTLLHFIIIIVFHQSCSSHLSCSSFSQFLFCTSMKREGCPQEPELFVAVGLEVRADDAT